MVDEVQPRKYASQVIDVGDGADDRNGDRPENDESNNGGDDNYLADDSFPPLNLEIAPNNLQ